MHWLIKEEDKALAAVQDTGNDLKSVFAEDDWLAELLAQPTNTAQKADDKKEKDQLEAKERFDKMKPRVATMRCGVTVASGKQNLHTVVQKRSITQTPSDTTRQNKSYFSTRN